MNGRVPCPIQAAATAEHSIWLLCEQKALFVSADGGVSWQERRLPETPALRAVAFLDARRGFVAGDSGTLLATGDGAETWRRVDVPTKENLTAIHFAGELGWVAGWSGVILHSSDHGKTWRRQETGIGQGLESIYFVDPSHGWAAGWMGTILRTEDGGKTWRKAETPDTLWTLHSVYFRDAREGWAVGFGGQVLKSEDGGATWRQRPSPLHAALKSVVFDAAGRGWIASDRALLLSEDDGESWRQVPVERDVFLHQVLRLKDTVWAVGHFGVFRPAGAGSGLVAVTLFSDTGSAP